MKKLSLLLSLITIAFYTNAQVKVFPGGAVSIGTTATPTSTYRGWFGGPVRINQSQQDQTLLYLNANDEVEYSNVAVSHSTNPRAKHYVVEFYTAHNFWVYSSGDAYTRGLRLKSDSTLKTQITTADSALHKLMQLRGVTYKFKEDIADTSIYGGANARTRYGVIAQEVNTCYP